VADCDCHDKAAVPKILEHSRNALPNEACGLLGGRIENGVKYVEKVYLLRNIDESPEHFSMNPKEQFAAVKDMRNNGWELWATFTAIPQRHPALGRGHKACL